MRGSISLTAVLTLLAVLGLTAGPAAAQVTIDSVTSGVGPGGGGTKTLITGFDASGSDKLVVVIGGEHGFPYNTGGQFNWITYNGIELTEAVQEQVDVPTMAIFYLDNPGAAGDLLVNQGNHNNSPYHVYLLSGTAGGVSSTAKDRSASVDLVTNDFDSLVIAGCVDVGPNNGGNGARDLVADLPLVEDNPTQYGGGGRRWTSVSAASATIPTPSLDTYSFSNTGATHGYAITAASFDPAADLYWDLNGTTPGAGGSTPNGTWDDVTTNFNSDAGGGAGGAISAWAPGSSAGFSAGSDANGSYAVSVVGSKDISGIRFETGSAVALTVGAGGALRLTDDSVLYAGTGVDASIATPIGEDANSHVLYKTGGGTMTISGDLSHTGGTVLGIGSGQLTLSGNNAAATGGTILNAVAQFDANVAIPGTARDVTVNAGGTAAFGASFGYDNIATALADRITAGSEGAIAADNYDANDFDFNAAGLTNASLGAVGTVNYTGTVTPNGTTYRLGGGGGTLTMVNANAVTGAGNSLTVVGPGTVVLGGANDYDGATTIAGGTLRMGDANSLGASQVLAFSTGSKGTLQLNDHDLSLVSLNSDGGTPVIENAAGATVTLTVDNAADNSYGGAIRGNGGTVNLVKENTGALTVSGSVDVPTVAVNGGTLRLGASNVLGDDAVVTVAAGAALDLNGNSERIKKIDGTGDVTSTATASTLELRNGGSWTYSGTISGDGLSVNYLQGNGTLTFATQQAWGGTLRVSNSNGAGGGYTMTVKLGVNDALPVGGPVQVDGQGENFLDLAGFDQTVGKVSLGSYNGGSRGQVIDSVGGGTLTLTDGVFCDDHNNGNGGISVTYLDLNGAEQIFEVRDGSQDSDLLVTSTVQNGSLTMKGLETNAKMELTGELLYEGNTTVQAGILKYNNTADGLDDASTVELFANAKLELNFVGQDTIAALILDGVDVGTGIFDSSHATYGSYFLGTGSLNVFAGLSGDTNGDGVVDATDYLAVKRNLGTGSGAGLADGDLDGDGDVDWDDLTAMTSALNAAAGAGTIPEPATLGLLAIGALALVRRRRRS